MLKKTSVFILSIVLIFSLAFPSLAVAENLDDELARVTKTVKQTLEIGDHYTKFDGNVTESGTYRNWYLRWNGNDESLSVTADSNGKILYYYHYKNENYKEGSYGYAPTLPKANREAAMTAAKEFVEKLLTEGETASFNENQDEIITARSINSYSFGGTIMLNGLKSPTTFNVSVLTDGMKINSFRRSDLNSRNSGSIPNPATAVSSEAAAKLLAGTLKLKLQYIQTKEEEPAVLRYLPVYTGNYIVKADTGELVNIDEIARANAGDSYAKGMGGEAASSKPAPTLTGAELKAVQSLEGVKSKEELDKALRSVSGIGLDDNFSLEYISYSKNSENGDVSCQLNYRKKIVDASIIKERFPDYYSSLKTEDVRPVYINKYIIVDAKTAGLKYISTNNGTGYPEKSLLNASQLETKASTFLKNNYADNFSKTALYKESSNADKGVFFYTEVANSIPFPRNSISISVDTYDGTIKDFNVSWKDGVKFDSAEGIVNSDTAMSEYLSCFKPVLQYVFVPSGKDNQEMTLVLAYRFEADRNLIGVDAKTGKAIIAENTGKTDSIAYDDLENSYGKMQIETLAKYGIGFAGKSFQPEAQLTQRDALILLLSAVGYKYDEKSEDMLYGAAYNYNLISPKEKEPERLLNRAEFIKIVVGATEYGSAAKLKGIFSCGFSDDSAISAEYYGYVAIAKALGIIKGDTENYLNPTAPASRQDAAIVLYNLMSR